MSNLDLYLALTEMQLNSLDNEDARDKLLDYMDVVWQRMTWYEKARANKILIKLYD